MKIELFFSNLLADVAWERTMTIPFIQREFCSSITVYFWRIYDFFLIFITELICMRTGPLFRGDSLDPDVCLLWEVIISFLILHWVVAKWSWWQRQDYHFCKGWTTTSSHSEIPEKQKPWFPANLFSNRKFHIGSERKETRIKGLCREKRAEQKPLCCLVGPCHPLGFSRFLIPTSSCTGNFVPRAVDSPSTLPVPPFQCPAPPFCFSSRFYGSVPFLLFQVLILISLSEELMFGIFCEAHRKVGLQMVEFWGIFACCFRSFTSKTFNCSLDSL